MVFADYRHGHHRSLIASMFQFEGAKPLSDSPSEPTLEGDLLPQELVEEGPPQQDHRNLEGVEPHTQERRGTGTTAIESEPDDEPDPSFFSGSDRVVKQLIADGHLSQVQLYNAWEEWQRLKENEFKTALWRVIALDASIDRQQVYRTAARVYAFPESDVTLERTTEVLRSAAEYLGSEKIDQLLELFVIPVDLEEQTPNVLTWVFATHDPSRALVHKTIEELKIGKYRIVYMDEVMVGTAISEGLLSHNEYLNQLNEDSFAYDLGTSAVQDDKLVDENELEAQIKRSSLITLFEATLVEAVHRGASDIHIVPNDKGQIDILFRIDGELISWHKEERVHPEALLAVVKDNSSNVDRFDRDKAQDGHISRVIGGVVIRFRVSILPIASHKENIHAESVVLRVIDNRKVLDDLSQIGLKDEVLHQFNRAIRQPHGMVIMTGPTGSGKSTTLVAALLQVQSPKVNVITVEDPVEYLLKGVRQIKLGPDLNMQQALRSILRHDPDIVMVGEMRDKETADLAIKLANTGHLTFSTLHTNDAPSAVSRLYKMGIEPFLLAYAINIVVAQRLIRKLCDHCKVEVDEVDKEQLRYLGLESFEGEIFDVGESTNCRNCGGTGYRGRQAIAETLVFTETLRHAILSAGQLIDEEAIRSIAVTDGMKTLRDAALDVARSGLTSLAEVVRVTGD